MKKLLLGQLPGAGGIGGLWLCGGVVIIVVGWERREVKKYSGTGQAPPLGYRSEGLNRDN